MAIFIGYSGGSQGDMVVSRTLMDSAVYIQVAQIITNMYRLNGKYVMQSMTACFLGVHLT